MGLFLPARGRQRTVRSWVAGTGDQAGFRRNGPETRRGSVMLLVFRRAQAPEDQRSDLTSGKAGASRHIRGAGKKQAGLPVSGNDLRAGARPCHFPPHFTASRQAPGACHPVCHDTDELPETPEATLAALFVLAWGLTGNSRSTLSTDARHQPTHGGHPRLVRGMHSFSEHLGRLRCSP